MARPIQPTGAGTSGDATIGWAIVGVFFAGLASGTLLWVAAGLVGAGKRAGHAGGQFVEDAGFGAVQTGEGE